MGSAYLKADMSAVAFHPSQVPATLGKFIPGERDCAMDLPCRLCDRREKWRSFRMRTKFAFCCIATACALAAMPVLAQPGSGYRILGSYTLGGEGGWDYLNLDPATGRLFITRGSHVMVVDPKSGKQLADIAGLS